MIVGKSICGIDLTFSKNTNDLQDIVGPWHLENSDNLACKKIIRETNEKVQNSTVQSKYQFGRYVISF